MTRPLVSELTIIEAVKRGDKILQIPKEAIITDAARDRAKQSGIKIMVQTAPPESRAESKKTTSIGGPELVVCLGSDHGGYRLKETLKPFIEGLGCKVVDLGTYSEESCDYPDFAYAVARTVSLGDAARGIMVDSVGLASAIVANKVRGIRATCCFDEYSARSSREHNNANVLTLGGKTIGVELAKAIVKTWLETPFGGGRHQKRIDKIAEIEKRAGNNVS